MALSTPVQDVNYVGCYRAPALAESTHVDDHIILKRKAEYVYDVEDYATVQAAIDAAEVTGGIVYLPAGTYDINVKIDSDNVTLQGEGASTILTSADGSSAVVELENVDNCAVRDVYIDGEWQTNVPGLLLEGCRWSYFQNILGDRMHGPLIDLRADGGATQNTNNNTFLHIHVENCVRFLRFQGNAGLTQYVTLNQFFNCSAVGAGTVLSTLVDFVRGADNNHFVGVCRLSLNYAGSIGVVFNSDSPAATRAVYENHFDDLMIDQSVASTVSLDVNDCTVSGSGPHSSRVNYRSGGSNPTAPAIAANGFITRPALLGAYTNANRPAAANQIPGSMIWNTDDGFPNWSDGTNWVEADGTST